MNLPILSEYMQGFFAGATMLWLAGNIAIIIFWLMVDYLKERSND